MLPQAKLRLPSLISSLTTRWGDKQRWCWNFWLISWSRISRWWWGRWRREKIMRLGEIVELLRYPGLGDMKLAMGSVVMLVLSLGGHGLLWLIIMGRRLKWLGIRIQGLVSLFGRV